MPFYCVATSVIGCVTSANEVRSHSTYKALSPAVWTSVPQQLSTCQHEIDTIVIMFGSLLQYII